MPLPTAQYVEGTQVTQEEYDNALRMVRIYAVRWFNFLRPRPCIGIEELDHEAEVAVYRAAVRFDRAKGYTFNTFALMSGLGPVKRYVNDFARGHVPLLRYFENGKLVRQNKELRSLLSQWDRVPRSLESHIGRQKVITSGSSLTLGDAIPDPRCYEAETTTREAVHQCLAKLRPKQAYAVKRIHLEEASAAEVAQELGVSRQAVLTALHRGEARFRVLYGGL